MAFDDRIRHAIYISPSGAKFDLSFESVERSGSKKAAVHEYPNQNKADIQDLGNNSERFPFDCFFSGEDYDKTAASFWDALSEKITQNEPAKFQHPRYGNIYVIPLSWSQTENFVDGLGRANFKIEFIKIVKEEIFPTTSVSSANQIAAKREELAEALKNSTLNSFKIKDSLDLSKINEQQTAWKNSILEDLKTVVETTDEIFEAVEETLDEIDSFLDEIESVPETFFSACTEIYDYVVESAGNMKDKSLAIAAHVENIFERIIDDITTPAQAAGIFHNSTSAVSGAFGIADYETNGDEVNVLATRTDAIFATEKFQEIYNTYLEIIEYLESEVEDYKADREIIEIIYEMLAIINHDLIQNSFDLKAEKKIVLTYERTPIDLCYELYGTISNIDDFIDQNELSGDEIILIPSGREIVYYE